MWNPLRVVLYVGATALMASSAVFADEHEAQQALLRLLPSAKVTLLQGLQASVAQGQPISAKFEVDDTTGRVAKAEPITEAEDLAAAKAQAAAMAKAKSSLAAAGEKAEHELAGYRTIGVTPEVKGGHAVAVVTLLKGTQFKSVAESLE